MAEVVLGRAGSNILVDLDVCAKTGRVTGERVTIRGNTTPGWVLVLLLFTVIGFFLAYAMTSRRYLLTLPFAHDAFARWKRNALLAWVVGLAGVASVIAGAADVAGESAVWGSIGIAAVVAALVGGTVNTRVNGLTVRRTRDEDLVLTGAHAAFARAVAEASVESVA